VVIGKIDYLNLLPFHIFIKKNGIKVIEKKGYPAQINRLFENRVVESAFISSIKSKNKNCLDAGIIANKKVLSVLICENKENLQDKESETSNQLAKILNLKGEVIIGDKALQKFYNENVDNCKDMAQLWFEKYKLPFVFARFCINKNNEKYKKLINNFLSLKVKIPQYILKKKAKQLNIKPSQLKEYLNLIYYQIGYKEKKSLRKFLKN
jgi:chorismate dehydratase